MPVQDTYHQGKGDISDDQPVNAHVEMLQQHIYQRHMEDQGNGGVGDGFAHQIDALEYAVGHGGQGEEDDRGSADRQKAGGQRGGVVEDQPHDRAGQDAHAHRAGDGDQHIEFDSQADLVLDRLVVILGPGCYDAGDHRRAQGGGDRHRHIGQKPVLAAVDAQQGHPFLFAQSLRAHELAEQRVVYGAAQLVDELAQHNGGQRHQQGDEHVPPGLGGHAFDTVYLFRGAHIFTDTEHTTAWDRADDLVNFRRYEHRFRRLGIKGLRTAASSGR